jgi:hypothetical protein
VRFILEILKGSMSSLQSQRFDCSDAFVYPDIIGEPRIMANFLNRGNTLQSLMLV